jgi:hypothetical protein
MESSIGNIAPAALAECLQLVVQASFMHPCSNYFTSCASGGRIVNNHVNALAQEMDASVAVDKISTAAGVLAGIAAHGSARVNIEGEDR